MLIEVTKGTRLPLYRQVIEKVKELIDRGDLKPGTPLPSTRNLAAKLGTHRATVYQAYQELQALGYLSSRPGSYTVVSRRLREVPYDSQKESLIHWDKTSTREAEDLYRIFLSYSPEKTILPPSRTEPVDLAALDPDPRLHPVQEFKRSVRHVLAASGQKVLQYGDYIGYKPLRGYVAQRLRLHGISVTEREILITNGAQQAIDLLIRLLAGPGRAAVVEAPTYANILPLLSFNGTKVMTVPMKEDGMDLDALERVLKREKVSFVYTMPNFQNPTGITSPHGHRERLLSLCRKKGVPIIEDGFEEEMKYFGKVDLPIKSMDEDHIVIYLGTFSKALFPGLRIGWVIAHRDLIARLTAIKRFSDLTSGTFIQAALHHFCEQGCYDLHLKRLHRFYRRRMQAALEAMEEFFPATVSWTRPLGGYTIWVEMPAKLGADELHSFLLPYGVMASPGCYYFPRMRPSPFLRISISGRDEREIEMGIKRLGKALSTLSSSAHLTKG